MGFQDLIIFGGVILYVVGAIAGALKKGKGKVATPNKGASQSPGQVKTTRGGGRREPSTGLPSAAKAKRATPEASTSVATPKVIATLQEQHVPPIATPAAEPSRPDWSEWQRAIVLSEVLGRPRGEVAHEPPA